MAHSLLRLQQFLKSKNRTRTLPFRAEYSWLRWSLLIIWLNLGQESYSNVSEHTELGNRSAVPTRSHDHCTERSLAQQHQSTRVTISARARGEWQPAHAQITAPRPARQVRLQNESWQVQSRPFSGSESPRARGCQSLVASRHHPLATTRTWREFWTGPVALPTAATTARLRVLHTTPAPWRSQGLAGQLHALFWSTRAGHATTVHWTTGRCQTRARTGEYGSGLAAATTTICARIREYRFLFLIRQVLIAVSN